MMRINDYRHEVREVKDSAGSGYVAFCPTLGEFTVYGFGDTVTEAIDVMNNCMDNLLAFWSEHGIEAPRPTLEDEIAREKAMLMRDDLTDNYAYAA